MIMSKINKIIKFILVSVAVFVIIVFVFVLYAYKPFIEERLAFDISYKNGKTHVDNKNVGISFDIDGECDIDSDVINFVAGEWLWYGKFLCGGIDNYVRIGIWSYNDYVVELRKKDDTNNHSDRIIINYASEENPHNFLTVINKEKTKMLDISIFGNANLFSGIVSSLNIE